MNWFKKKFSKLFNDEIEDYEEEIQYEEIEEPSEVTNEENKRHSFRFPIIADDELDQIKPDVNRQEMKRPVEAVYDNQQINNIVLDVEVSGIRDLLEQRRNGKGKTVRKHIVEDKQPIKPKTIGKNSPKPIKQSKELEIDETQKMNRRRFVPTQVPSPVHGFKKPSPINQLLEKSEQKNARKDDLSFPVIHRVLKDTETASQEVASTIIQETQTESKMMQVEALKYQEKQNLHNYSYPFESQKGNNESQLLVQQLANDLLLDDEKLNVNEESVTLEDTYLESIDYDQDSNESLDIQDEDQDYIDEMEDDFREFEHINNVEIIQEMKKDHEEFDHNVDIDGTDIEEIDEDSFDDIEEFYDEEDPVYEIIEDTVEFEGESEELTNERELDNNPNEEILSYPLNTVEDNQIIHNASNESNKIASGSKLPFNVLMLKSDKEKLKLKESLEKGNAQSIEQNIIVNNIPSSETNMSDENDLPKNEETEIEMAPSPAYKEYVKPTFEFLVPPEEKTEDLEWMESQADNLVESLSHFQVTANVESIVQGPAVTQFEITVGHGTKVSKIKNLADDLKLALAAKDIRIQAPIPGKSSIGIEIPNRISRAVRLSEVIRSEVFIESDSPLEAALGLDLTGKPITIDLRKMPHGLIAGATGSGKSVCINSILVSLLYKADPHELKLMLIDPKVVELAPFNNIPHLVSPVITDVKTATAALKWAVEEMERRYQLFAHVGVRDLSRFNKQAEKNGDKNKLPYILIVIDELADLMMMAPSDVEESIARIAQKARACGIHLIVATQRPSVDVITGLIKSNIPTRIAFAVSSQIDSRTILDGQGAERLLGRGDMLYLGNGMSAPIRIQGTFVTDDEIEDIIDHVRSQGVPNYMFEHEELLKKSEIVEEYDELFEEVCRFVYEQGTASTSSIQRNYHIGYNRAARLMDLLEKNGFISEQKGSKPREVYIKESDLISMFD